ncbi:MAG: putative 4-hydroxybenzoate polyprenyltransferase [Planctomycetales bacterium]|nr:putative 4-hydroxybenzoate polyprenyltransferase [Planctomycetales bacterium]
MIRFSHTVFALPFALLAAVMAWTSEPAIEWRWRDLVGIVLCMVTARSVAMAFNRIADRRIDAANPRTAGRHLPAGTLSLGWVVGFCLASAIGFVASTALFLPNRWPLILAVPVLLFVCGYSYAKRFTAYAHFWLGAALMLAPVATWLALRGTVEAPALLLGGAVLFWVAGFDMIYACQDHAFDSQAGLHSMPAWLGVATTLRLAAVSHAVTVALLVALAWEVPALRWIYGSGLALVAVLLAYEHWIVRPDDLTRVNVAFFNLNALVSLGLLAVGSIDLLW